MFLVLEVVHGEEDLKKIRITKERFNVLDQKDILKKAQSY